MILESSFRTSLCGLAAELRCEPISRITAKSNLYHKRLKRKAANRKHGRILTKLHDIGIKGKTVLIVAISKKGDLATRVHYDKSSNEAT